MTPVAESRSVDDLARRLGEAEATIEALVSGKIDAVVDPGSKSPVLLAKAQDALRQSEERYRTIVETTSEGIWTVGSDLITTFVNRRLAEMLGYGADEMIGRSALDFAGKSLASSNALMLLSYYLQGSREEREIALTRKDGSEIWMLVKSSPIRNSVGLPDGTLAMLTDITERRQAAETLRVIEERTRFALQVAKVGIWDADFVTGSARWSEELEAQYGLQPGTFGGTLEAFFNHIHPADRADTLERIAAAQVSGLAFSVSHRTIWPDGTVHWLGQQGRIALGAHGEPLRGTGISQDITERRLAEEEHRHRAAELAESQRITRIGSWEWMTATGVIAWSEGMNHILARAYGSPSPTFQTVSQFYTHDSWQRLGAAIATTVESGASYDLDLEMIRADGTTFWTTTRGEAVRADDGTVVKLRGNVLDISERKRTEAELRLQSAALNAAGDAIVITNHDGAIVWMNPAFSSLSGYSSSEALGANPRTLIKSEVHGPAFFRQMWETLLAGGVWRGEITNRRKDGTQYPEAMTITPVKDIRGEITHFIAIKQDLTATKLLQAQFLQAQRLESVGRLAGGIAHDFNNMLTVIMGYTEIATRSLPKGEGPHLALGEVLRAGEKAAKLTSQLLAFSRKQVLQPSVLDLNVEIAGMQGMLRRLLREDIALVVVPGEDLGSVLVDRGQIEQVVMNLAVNARDAMANGGTLTFEMRNVELDETFTARHAAMPPGPYVMLEVRDTGQGMDRETLSHLFEPFFTTKETSKGTGLGLSTVFGIVEQSGGSIEVSSKIAEGTTFTIYLPRAKGEAPPEHVAGASTTVRGSGTILLVEDEDQLRQMTGMILREVGYTVIVARDGDEALRLLAAHEGPVHLVLTDMILPGRSGADIADEVVRLRPDVKILITSGYADAAVLHNRVLDIGIPFIAKPYTMDGLTSAVRDVLHPLDEAYLRARRSHTVT